MNGLARFLQSRKNNLRWAVAPLTRRAAARARTLERPEDWLAFVNSAGIGTLRTIQQPREICAFSEAVRELRPRVVLEIGTARGGTLFFWSRCAADDALLISADLPGGDFGGGYPVWKSKIFRAFTAPAQELRLLRADSHLPQTRDAIASILDGRAIDFLFIDGDHTLEGVRQDFEQYAPLVREGGLIGFHDIAKHPRGRGGEVHRFWASIRDRYDHEEFVTDPAQGFGLGLIRWQGEHAHENATPPLGSVAEGKPEDSAPAIRGSHP